MIFKKYKIKKVISNIETHEVFLDNLAQIKEEELGLSEKKFEVRIKEKIIYVIFGLFFIFSAILFFKTFYLQVFNGKQLYNLSENNKAKINLIRPERGIIYDKNFKKLVLNSPAFDFVCDKRNFFSAPVEYIKEIENIAEILQDRESFPQSGSSRPGVDSKPSKKFDELKEQIIKSEESKILISENITHELLLVLEARMNDFPDCQIEKNTTRNYVTGPVFSHVLGYTGKVNKEDLQNTNDYTVSDYIGKVGLERSYEEALRGIPGKIEVIKNASGLKKGDRILSLPKEGYNLVLNIDVDLQNKVYDSLERSIKNIGAKKGAAVALDPRTGAVLALVSYPAFDNNIFSARISQSDFDKIQNDPYQPFFNRVISAQYPTGSTIKPFLASGALQEKIISPEKLINDPGYILVSNQYNPSIVYKFGGVAPHGLVDMRKAIAVSSNIYFYTIGGGYEDQQGLGPTRIKKYLDLFGWEQKTGIDLPGEFSGFVPSPDWKKQFKKESWWDGDTYNLSIGQSDLQVTPLQVVLAYSAIANGGILYKPQIVQKIIEGSGKNSTIIKELKPEIINQNFIDSQNLQIVREGMRDGVAKSYGSSYMLNDLPVQVAGKTGTAETGKSGYYNTWSSAFAPYNNPEIVFVATIESVEGLRAATLPVTHEVLQYYFSKNK